MPICQASGAGHGRASLEGIERIAEVVVDVKDFAHVCGAGQGGSDPKVAVAGAIRLACLHGGDDVALRIVNVVGGDRVVSGRDLGRGYAEGHAEGYAEKRICSGRPLQRSSTKQEGRLHLSNHQIAKDTPPDQLRNLLAQDRLHVMPCCFDALSARMIERAGFEITFMSGFAVSAARLAVPDTGLISYGEMLDQGRSICEAVELPVIGDADTGYGNPMNVRRTVEGYARAGFAGAMIEDQVAPKRCGHTRGKEVVDRRSAYQRVQAAVEARESGADILVMARTDARAGHGLDEAIERCRVFADLGADILFLEAPQNEAEMETLCRELPSLPKMANIVEGGDTPALPPARLEEIGFKIAAYPLTLLSSAARAMEDALAALAAGIPAPQVLSFEELQALVGFPAYDEALGAYAKDGSDAEEVS